MRISFSEAIQRLKQGEVVAIPTETVYGLAADARNENALRRIYAIKERPSTNPLIVHLASMSQVEDWASVFSPLAQTLAHTFWPGPFTLVLPAKPTVSSIVRAGQPTIALRIPAHPTALKLLQESDLALAAPSANKFTQLSPTNATHVEQGLGDAVAVLDGGDCQVGIESTIVRVQDDDWQLLRLGMIAEADIAAVAGKAAVEMIEPIQVPGQHHLHYSPRTPMCLFASREALIASAEAHIKSNTPAAALVLGSGAVPTCPYLELNKNAAVVAQALYDTLHKMDALGVEVLLIEAPPNEAEWLAVLDRLTRAAAVG